MSDDPARPLDRTPLYDLHVELGAKMGAFAGYDMPIRYPPGIIAEHLHTRASASLFDVSHMGQATLRGADRAAVLEEMVPGDVRSLAPGRMRYTMLTDEQGGILDDLIVTNVGDYLFLVVNAARKAADLAHLRSALAGRCEVEALDARALLALQGPQAAAALTRIAPGAAEMGFMSAAPFIVAGSRLAILRSGYTGEDGFELSVPAADAERIARLLLADDRVAPAGLGARDSLRLEAGLCLYGQDIDASTTPVEAGLQWTIPRRRREEGGYPGAGIVGRQLRDGAARRRVGLRPDGRAPARAHTRILSEGGAPVGEVTSGGYGPTVGGPVAMGYVDAAYAEPGARVDLLVRGAPRPARVTALPFVPHRYAKPLRRTAP